MRLEKQVIGNRLSVPYKTKCGVFLVRKLIEVFIDAATCGNQS